MESRGSFWATKRRRLNPIEHVDSVFSNESPATGWFDHLSMFASKVSNLLFHRETVMSAEIHSDTSTMYSPERRRRKPEAKTGKDGVMMGGSSALRNGSAVRESGAGPSTRQRMPTITLDDDDNDGGEYVTDDEDDVVEVTPREFVSYKPSYATPAWSQRPSSSGTGTTRVSHSTTEEVEVIKRNGFPLSSPHTVDTFKPPVELNSSFEKEDTPFEDALADVSDTHARRGLFTSSEQSSRCTVAGGGTVVETVASRRTVAGGGTVVERDALSTVWKRDFEEQPEEEVVTSSGSLSRSSSVEVIAEHLSFKGPSSGTASGDVTPIASSSPSLQFDSGTSRTVSPLYMRPGSRDRIDKWSRRNRSLPWSSRNRPKPRQTQSLKWESPVNKIRKQLGIGSPGRRAYESVINMEDKERFRRLNTLMEAGGANFVPSSRSPYVSAPRSPSGGESVLQRGKAALHALLIATRDSRSDSSHPTSPGSTRSDDGSDVQILDDIGNVPSSSGTAQPVLNRQLSSHEVVLPRRSSASSIRSDFSSRRTSVSVVWDKQRDDALKAKWETEQSNKELYRQRELSYEQKAQQRNRLAHELALEKRLLVESRRDEETHLEEELIKKLTITGHVFRNRFRKPIEDEFPELSDEAEALVDRVWNRRLSKDERLSGEITRSDLMTLSGLDWLNDEVINCYMNLICQRANNDKSLPKVYAFTTFFYPTLYGKGYASVRRWTRKVDIFSFDILLMPIHLGAHWCLATVDFANKRVDYYDSMGGENKQCLITIGKYLGDEMMDKKKTRFDLTGWKLITRDDIPQQMNGSDCGMFTSKFAEYASRRAKLTFTQQHMPYFRRRMVYEICTRKLMQ